MDDKEIAKILKLVAEAYKKAGKKIETAIQYNEGESPENGKGTILIDNRKEEEVN